ncbi:MAG: ABC transporter substrate-binding protein [Ruminococcaceae bacterium]|nr:ABC transporter substrate-binding protein [Oscillospiraceae bacterium]
MKNFKRILALTLALIMCVAMFAACGETKTPSGDNGDEVANDTPLVVGYAPFSSKFSPFFSETAYDQDVQAMTQLGLLTSDRTGAIILKGIEGETIEYNGTPYTYNGPADLTITQNDDGTVYYDFVLRDDVTFSDGEKLTVDDVIFSMYVLCDPTYDGSSTLFAVPIQGMDEYRSGMDSRLNLVLATEKAGYTATDFFTEDQYNTFWAAFDAAGVKFAQEILDYCVAAGYGTETDSVATVAANWGYTLAEDATVEDFWAAIVENCGYDLSDEGINYETAGTSISAFINAELGDKAAEYAVGVQTGESAANISGIQKTGENSLRVVLTKVDATAIYQLGVAIAPLHYYGSDELFDYDNNKFGFVKGDLASVRAKTTQPMGAGPYKFVKFENGVVYFEANESYFLGAPKTKYVQFMETASDDDKLNGVITGTIDISDPSIDEDTVDAIKKANGGELSGSKVYTNTVDNLGYGYLGIDANLVSVGGDGASDASKNLRKALATVFAVYRDVSVDSYYGERATVINYPISNTSWAAPQATDDGYKVAFSTDVEGNAIYTSEMTADEKYAAALTAALGYFEAAGYTVEDGKLTAAPEGASLQYELWIPADGKSDHPAFMMVSLADDALATIGFDLVVKDLANSSDLWTGLEAETVAMWCAAWGATVDPDMYQIYFSGNDTMAAGGSNYMYDIDDDELNQLILDARTSLDQAYRKTMYKACLDIVVDWAVEVPVYQRQNAIIFSAERVNLDTITPDITTFYGWMAEIQNLEMK